MRSKRYLDDAILGDSDCPWRDDLSAKTRCRSDEAAASVMTPGLVSVTVHAN